MIKKIIILTIFTFFVVGGLFMIMTGGFNEQTSNFHIQREHSHEIVTPSITQITTQQTIEIIDNKTTDYNSSVQVIKLTMDSSGNVKSFDQISGDKVNWKNPNE